MELTLFHLDEKLVLEDPPDVLFVRPLIGGENQDIVQVDEHKVVEHISENIINQSLEHSWANGITKYS